MSSERFETNERAIHIRRENENDWEVWLNTTVSDFDGLCVGSGVSRAQAIADAVELLELITARLRRLNEAQGQGFSESEKHALASIAAAVATPNTASADFGNCVNCSHRIYRTGRQWYHQSSGGISCAL